MKENLEKMEPKLVSPSLKYKDSYTQAAKEFENDKNTGFTFHVPGDNFDEFLKKLQDSKKGIGLREGYVPQSEFWLVEGSEFIGSVKIRHKLNDQLLIKGGHIGYGIRPSMRGEGYGTKILDLALKEAKKLGIKKVLVTCDDNNIGSAKIIEKNGGVLENKVDYEGSLKRRYWIEIK